MLAKVELGEVDAGVVYVTDVRAAGDKVKGIAIPDDVNASTDLPDRGADQGSRTPARLPGLRRLRAVGRRADGAVRRRIRASLERARVTTQTRRPARAAASCGQARRSPAVCRAPSPCRRSIALRVPAAAAGRRCSCGRPGAAWAGSWPSRRLTEALRLSLVTATVGDRGRRWCSACRSRGCWPASEFPGSRLVRAWSRCRSCCRRSSAASPCCSRFGRNGVVGRYLDQWFGDHAAVHARPASSWPRRSSRCRSSS